VAATHWSSIELIAGQPGGPGLVDGSAVQAHFSSPVTGAVDESGRLYLADGHSIRVVRLADGSVSTLIGSTEFGAQDGVGSQVRLNTPGGVVATPGKLFIADTENHTIRQVDLASISVKTIAGTMKGLGSADGVGAEARFNEPEGLALDSQKGLLYIADTDNHLIRRMALDSLEVITLAGTPGIRGSADGPGQSALLDRPAAIALDQAAENLYWVGRNVRTIRKLSLADNVVSTVATLQEPPTGLTIDGSNLLLTVLHQIVRVDLSTGAVSDFAGGLSQGFVDASGPDARFNSPIGLIPDGSGGLIVVDAGNFALRRLELTSTAVSSLSGANSAGIADGSGADARFNDPHGVAAGNGVVYVADTKNHLIRKVDLGTRAVTTLAGSPGQTGSVDGIGAAALFNHPAALALDAKAQTLYVADTENRVIRLLEIASSSVTTLDPTPRGFPGLTSPAGLVLDRGQLYVTDDVKHVVVAIDLEAQTMSVLAGKFGSSGAADLSGVEATFNAPHGIAADGGGHLYVSDMYNNTIRQVDIRSGAVTTVAGAANRVGSDDGVGGAARFFDPSDLALASGGNLLVADLLNLTVRRITLASGTVTTPVGTKLPGVTAGPLPGQIGAPTAMCLTPEGNLVLVCENAILLVQ
jgi:DNA-binding beta-propeller fold protein YncE